MNNDQNDSLVPTVVPYITRVFSNDATRKGLAAAAAGLFVAIITEAVWPTR